MEMLIGGTWQPAASGRTEDVTSPFDGTVTWRRTPAHERMRILLRAAELADQRAEQTAQLISAEAGKTITEAKGGSTRARSAPRCSG